MVEGQDWFVIYRRHDVGLVKDDDKNAIDADAILKGISEGTEEANKERAKNGGSAPSSQLPDLGPACR